MGFVKYEKSGCFRGFGLRLRRVRWMQVGGGFGVKRVLVEWGMGDDAARGPRNLFNLLLFNYLRFPLFPHCAHIVRASTSIAKKRAKILLFCDIHKCFCKKSHFSCSFSANYIQVGHHRPPLRSHPFRLATQEMHPPFHPRAITTPTASATSFAQSSGRSAARAATAWNTNTSSFISTITTADCMRSAIRLTQSSFASASRSSGRRADSPKRTPEKNSSRFR